MSEFKKIYSVMLVILSMCFAADYAVSCDEIYFKVGAGYKFNESANITFYNKVYKLDPQADISARFEIGRQQGNWSYGVSHHSQWETGKPFNNKDEYSKTEAFIDYKISWSM